MSSDEKIDFLDVGLSSEYLLHENLNAGKQDEINVRSILFRPDSSKFTYLLPKTQ